MNLLTETLEVSEEVVRVANRVPRSLCHVIENFSRINRRSGKAIN